jgi:murein DD-endopeptidase MepM/ murein hydrolase activator NlpD
MTMAVLVAVVGTACSREVPEVGRLDGVYVPPAETLRIYSLSRGKTFGELLSPVISANEQASLLMAFSELASPRRMRQGTEITLRYLREDDSLRGVDVTLTPDQTVRLSKDQLGWSSDLVRTPIYVDTIFASGEIESVLWNAVVHDPALETLTYADRNALIDHLDRVFQWQVDFSRQIRVGDTYRFAFEREVRPDGSMRSGRLLAAELLNQGSPFHAIYFDPNGDGRGSYFDLEGESVRRAFLLKPLAYRRISSGFTNSRFHPVLQRWRAHRGVDYAANAGTEVMVTADGQVIERGWDNSYGNTIRVRHGNGWVTRYAHMRAFKAGITVGSRVSQGDIIGYVGMTGLATGNHLHYEMLQSGQYKDPLSVDLPAGDPVPSENRMRWLQEMNVRVALLESIPGAGPVRTLLADAQTQQPNGAEASASGGMP